MGACRGVNFWDTAEAYGLLKVSGFFLLVLPPGWLG